MTDTPAVIVYITAAAGMIGGGVALYNAWKAAEWKRAELASAYLRQLTDNPELLFACRVLDWDFSKLVVPESLSPLLGDGRRVIDHDWPSVAKAMEPDLLTKDMNADPRLQLYRTAIDALLSWMGLVANAVELNLFSPGDIKAASYWIFRIRDRQYAEDFITSFGYRRDTERLRTAFAPFEGDQERPAASVPATSKRGGFGTTMPGTSVGG